MVMKRLLSSLALLLPCAAHAQLLAPGPQVQVGCVPGIACQAASLALGGATIGANALAVTGTSLLTGTVNVTGSMIAAGNVDAGGASIVGWVNRTSLTSTDGTLKATNNAASRAFTLDFSGIPVPTGTGTPTIATGSTDAAGEVTSGTSATSLVITFSSVKTNAPFCTVTPQTQLLAFAYTITGTAITITQTATTGEKVDYFCVQH